MSDAPSTSNSPPSSAITRVSRSKKDAIEWYDRLSPYYDALARLDAGPRNRGIDALGIERGERVLDVGTGTGAALVPFATAAGPTGSVVGLDISRGMCEQARATAEAAGVADTVSVVRGDGERLPVTDGCFDALFACFTLELFDTPALPAVLGEWKRVLRREGRLGVVSLSRREAGLATRVYELAHGAFPEYLDCRPIYVRELLAENGFSLEVAETHSLWGLGVDVVVARPTSERS